MAQTPMARERLFALRETIARIENENVPGLLRTGRKGKAGGFDQEVRDGAGPPPGHLLPLGIPALDAVLEGGLPLAGLVEIRTAETRDAGAAMGFVLALCVLCQHDERRDMRSPVLWIGQGMAGAEAGLPYGRGLQAYGLDIGRFIVSNPRTLTDALWIAEAALSAPVFAAVILEVRGNPAHFGLNESRRLHLRARSVKAPLFLLRQAGEEEASSALFRLRVAPAAAAGRPLPDGSMLAGSIGNPGFRITVEKSRAFSPADLYLEWSSHARRFRQIDPQTDARAAASPANRQSADSVAELSASAGGPGGADEMGRVMAFQKAS